MLSVRDDTNGTVNKAQGTGQDMNDDLKSLFPLEGLPRDPPKNGNKGTAMVKISLSTVGRFN